jgi:hypothetical protein
MAAIFVLMAATRRAALAAVIGSIRQSESPDLLSAGFAVLFVLCRCWAKSIIAY